MEISNWAEKNNIKPAEAISLVKNVVNILPLNEVICLDTVSIRNSMHKKGVKRFGLADGIILASARAIDQKVLTRDKGFKKVSDAIIL